LGTQAVQTDHALVGRTIERLQTLVGDEGLTLRMARARWLLDGKPSDKEVTEASVLLSEVSRSAPESVAPRLMLVACLEKLGNVSAAIEQLVVASNLQPESARIALELARLLHVQGDYAQAQSHLDRVLKGKAASDDERRQAAALLASEGQTERALKVYEELNARDQGDHQDLMLAALYRQQNQPEKAEALCRKLLAKPDARVIAFAADLYASTGHLPDAKAALAQLDSLQLPPGTKELIRGDFSVRHETAKEAEAQFVAATTAAPANPATWRELVAFRLAAGQVEPALAAATEGSRLVPTDKSLQAVSSQAKLISGMGADPNIRPLLVALVRDPDNAAPLVETLQILATARDEKQSLDKVAVKIRPLADRHPRLLPLQMLLLQIYDAAGQTDDALTLAARSEQSFPTLIEPARLATDILAKEGRWDEVLGAAQEWRRRSAGEPVAADVAIAGASLNLPGHSNEALLQIQPYIEKALTEPDKNIGLIAVYIRALLATNQTQKATDTLMPLLSRLPAWRLVGMSLAARSTPDAKTGAAWLEHVASAIPDNAPNEKLALAQFWRVLGARLGNKEYDKIGRDMLAHLAQGSNATAEILQTMGVTCESEGNLPQAALYYRMTLQAKPEAHVAANNLAMVIVRSHGDLAEAEALANRAIKAAPRASYYDTRASVLAGAKNYEPAVASLKEAIKLDPQNPEWRINLSGIQVDAGNKSEARVSLQQATELLRSRPILSDEVKQRYDDLKVRLQ